ncbi:MAG: DUF5615 family PIN-like protein [Candidatus Bipolaricaulia bacterium]
MGEADPKRGRPVKLLLDENVHEPLAAALRREGFDAITVGEAGRRGISDLELLKFATAEERAVVSFNIKHFEALAVQLFKQGQEHCGIIVSPERGLRDVLQRLLKLLEEYDAGDLKNQLRYL